jgi:hypothetical protein
MSDKSKFLAQYGHEDHLKTAINSCHQKTIEAAAKNPLLPKENIDKLVNSTVAYRRVAVAKNPNLSPDHVDKLVNDPEEDVRMEIASHHNLTKAHVDKLMNDKSDWVPRQMIHNPKVSLEQAKIGHKNIKDNTHQRFLKQFVDTAKRIHGYDL